MAAYNGRSKNPFEDELDEYEFDAALSKLEQTQHKILNSATRSLNMIEESHDIAIETAKELECQEEQLHRIDRNLDDMQKNMTSANRHIRSVKSVWGALGNYFSKPSEDKKQETTGQAKRSLPIPEKPLRIGIDADLTLNYEQQDYLSDYGRSRGTDEFDRKCDSHLDQISRGLSILKDDALVLGDTMDRHDEIIQRINTKTDLVHGEVQDADRKVRRILRK